MPAYCVAANCNNSQTTPGITMHELPRSRPAVRRKWIKFIQFKRADFLAAPHHAYLCSEHFSECEWGFASKLTRCSGTLSKSCLTGSNWYGYILVGLSGKVSVSSSELELAILQRLPSDLVGIWSRDLGVMAMLSVRQKMPFFRAFITLRSVSPTSSFSVSFNGNRVKNHPYPWTLRKKIKNAANPLYRDKIINTMIAVASQAEIGGGGGGGEEEEEEEAHERMHLLLLLLTQKKAAHKTKYMCSLVVYIFLVILFISFILTTRNYF